MIKVEENRSLKELNSFGVEASARHFVSFEGVDDLRDFFKCNELISRGWNLLSGGNNVLLLGDYSGTILHPVSSGIEVVETIGAITRVRVDAGVEWDDFVAWTVEKELGGIENLSLIPGYVGAAPIQNIGAYGVEVKDTIHSVDVYLVDKDEVSTLSAEECEFGYRDSIFKHSLKGRAIILSVTFCLTSEPIFHIGYGDLKALFEGVGEPSLERIRNAVIAIRNSKLPDPKMLGNAGSFFKNPIVEGLIAKKIEAEYPNMPSYFVDGGMVKLAAGWLIDRAGWKGKRKGNVGVHALQALVLVNYGGATGAEILLFAQELQQAVEDKFGVCIEMEVNTL